MSHDLQFYIDGVWVDPVVAHPFDIVDPSNEEIFAQISLGSAADVDRAVAAAKRALLSFSHTSLEAVMKHGRWLYWRHVRMIGRRLAMSVAEPRSSESTKRGPK